MAKPTPFYQKHIECGGKMVEFAGFSMPIHYRNGVIEECKRVRSAVGVFDVSHMGEIEIRGEGREDFLNWMTVNDLSKLDTYQAQYTAMCYPDGGIVDDLVVYKLPQSYFMVVNAANTEKDYDWLLENKKGEVKIDNLSQDMAQLAVQGPEAEQVMQEVVDLELSLVGYYWSAQGKVSGAKAIISRTGYTGEDGFEVYFDSQFASEVWDAIFEAGREFDIEPVGLGARDTLRLEMRYCLYGNDMDKTTTPLEAGLNWIVKLEKSEFIGRDALIRQKEEGVKRRLVAFEPQGRAIPRHDYPILKEGRKIGGVTSGGYSPVLEKPIGLGYVKIPHDKIGTEVEIEARGTMVKAVIVKPPFYKKGTHK